MRIKLCKDCGIKKPCSEFHHLGGIRNNIAQFCLDCYKKRLQIENEKIELFINGLKTCVKCYETKPLYMFHNNKLSYDGKNCYCKLCAKIVNSKYIVNPELKRANKQRYRFKNREFINKKQNEKRKTNKFKSMANTANKRARERGQLEVITKGDLWKVAKRQKMRCALSGKKLTNENISLDHILAMSRGGKNIIENIQLLDNSINLMKNSHLQDDFLEAVKSIYLYSISSQTREI